MHRVLNGIAIVSITLMATVGCHSMTGQSLGTNIDNATTTTEVKAKLAADRLQNLTWVGVDTNNGVVYLTGNAETQAQKERAGEIARDVRGVDKVVNNIQVQSASATTAPAASPGTVPGRYTMSGEVTSVDHTSGQLGLKTAQGDMTLYVPPAALANVERGDHVSVDVGIRPTR
jgi:hypothetical protein